MVPAVDRLPGVRNLIAGGDYFVVHAPRQTGKTTALKALVREINAKGEAFALYCTLESLQSRADPLQTNSAIRDIVADNVEMSPFYSPIPGAPALKEERGGRSPGRSDGAAKCQPRRDRGRQDHPRHRAVRRVGLG